MEIDQNFESLTPDFVLDAVEQVIGKRVSGMLSPLPSYINRVYEVSAMDGTRLIAKFYRPGRWSREAIEEEHLFLQDCAEEEVPVVAPLAIQGTTLHESKPYLFALFPKRLGRFFEVTQDRDWERIGALIGRIHVAGSRRKAQHRTTLSPMINTVRELNYLKGGGFLPRHLEGPFFKLTDRILETIAPLFQDVPLIRVHGDCHRGNILDRMEEGLMIIDFDDMAMAPPIQDLWLLLPDHIEYCRQEFYRILEGYEQFVEFDDATTILIEPLRIMRILYFLTWCAKQSKDISFRKNFPDWGSAVFWEQEMVDLEKQLALIRHQ